jgi:apolipoprotein N-acyltransferase
MTETAPSSPARPIGIIKMLPLIFLAVISFHLAYSFKSCSFLIVLFLYCLFQLTRVRTTRRAFYAGLVIGLLSYAPQSLFFWTIFGPSALALWCILALWLGLFLVLGRFCRFQFGKIAALFLLPFLWTGLEYFRSELYFLRFSWLNVGYAFSGNLPWLPLQHLGVYGIGFVAMGAISLIALLPRRRQQFAALLVLLAALGVTTNFPAGKVSPSRNPFQSVLVAGAQMEFPSELQTVANLDRLVQKYPLAKLLLLSEYSVDGSVPEKIKNWCAKNQRYLVIGGKDPASDSQFYDSVFVVGPDGNILFQQAKCVPVQFMKDGLPAREQKLWDSPWGKIGLCICYDLSYARVTDELIRQGAQAIIVPSMDSLTWGRQQHELHARVALVRAAEYGVPVFRLASSGISQFVNPLGCELATAPTPGDEATLSAPLELNGPGKLPWDRNIAPFSVWTTGVLVGCLAIAFWKQKIFRKSNRF